MIDKIKNFEEPQKLVWNHTLFDKETIHQFQQGDLHNAYDYFGSHPCVVGHQKGYYFSVWAPNAKRVAVVGDFNQWDTNQYIILLLLV
jgi:1,4-alpha-glucan branching enzyme